MASGRTDLGGAAVVVVGAGPTGLTVACELALAGTPVTVFDLLDQPMAQSRASTVHARTMELWDVRGLLGDVVSPTRTWTGHFAGMDLSFAELPSAHAGVWKIGQQEVEAGLAARAVSLGVDIRRGSRVVAVTASDASGVLLATDTHGIHHEWSVGWLVACDGQDSTIRTLMALDFPGDDGRHGLYRADVSRIDIVGRRFQRLTDGLAIAAPVGASTRIMVHAFGVTPSGVREEPAFDDVASEWERVTGDDIRAGHPVWLDSFTDRSRQLTSYRHGRVLFAGDAAHNQMPTGGQAMNLGVQDAFNLGWKLGAVARGGAAEDLLDSYQRERHPIGQRTLANIRAQTMLLLGDERVEPLRQVLKELLEHAVVQQHLAGMVSGLDVSYPATAGKTTGDVPGVGSRWIDADPAAPLRMEDGRRCLVTLSGAAPALEGLDARTGHRSVPALNDQLPSGTTAVLVRPDAYVSWAGSDGHGLGETLRLENPDDVAAAHRIHGDERVVTDPHHRSPP